MNILALTRYGTLGASSRVRVYQYLPYLRSNGMNVEVQSLLDDAYLKSLYARAGGKGLHAARCALRRMVFLLKHEKPHVYWIQKELFPHFPFFFENCFLHKGVPVVFDFDDAFFHEYETHPNPVVRVCCRNKFERLMARADMVLAGSPYLAEHARQRGARRVEVIPTTIDLDRYPDAAPGNIGCPVIGWIGTPLTQFFLDLIAEPLARLARFRQFRFLAVGARELRIPGVDVELVPWSETSEVEVLARCDIGVMPLYENPFERGKCGYKLIQFMGLGRPVVASPVGVNREIVSHGRSGFLAASSDEWERYLGQLLSDSDLRTRLGSQARSIIAERYSLQYSRQVLADLFQEIAEGASPLGVEQRAQRGAA